MQEKVSITTSLLPLIVRIQQLDSFRAFEVDNYSLPPSTLVFEDITKVSFNFSSNEIVPVLFNLLESLLDIQERMQAIKNRFESDCLLMEALGKSVYDSANLVEEETFGLMVEIQSLIKIHEIISIDPIKGINEYNLSLPPSRVPKQILALDLNQYALFFKYLQESNLIYDYAPHALAPMISPLIALSQNTLRTALSPGELDKTKKGARMRSNENKKYNLIAIRKKIEEIIELINRDLEIHHNK